MVMVPAGKLLPLSAPRMKLLVCLVLWLAPLATGGCDSSATRPSASSSEPRVEKLKTNINIDDARQLAEPASKTPGLSVDANAAQNAAVGSEVYNGMEPPKGLKTNRLFDVAVQNNDERFERLEAAVQKMRDDFDAVNPSINRLISIEGEIQSLVDQLNVLVGKDGQGSDALSDVPPVPASMVEDDAGNTSSTQNLPPVSLTPAASAPPPPAPPTATPAAPPVQAPPPPPASTAPVPQSPAKTSVSTPSATTSGSMILAVRAADHDTSTRVVFEMSSDMPYTASVDPENILIVSFIQGIAQGDLSKTRLQSDIIKSVDATPQNNGGLIVAMPLKKTSQILKQGVLKPDAQNPHYRLYIDIKK